MHACILVSNILGFKSHMADRKGSLVVELIIMRLHGNGGFIG